MPRRHPSIAVLLLAALLALGVACTGNVKDPGDVADRSVEDQRDAARDAAAEPETRAVETEPFSREAVERQPVDDDARGTAAELNAAGVLATVYFAFDSVDLSDDARATIQANADWLQANPRFGVVVEGHCDERGTIEYNIALGDRRARTVRDYLTSLGVDAGRVRVVSYGEERPQDAGHDESAWARNRRAEFVIEE
jgi:peptidoglycan-associated lipoprotein